jgi:3',5'-cyclic AMP phosphodiesterase CpdA
MTIANVPLRIAQVSDIHCGEPTFDAGLMASIVEAVNATRPDLVVVAGDLTAAGYEWEFEEAVKWLDLLEPPKVVIPGNHDARNVGYLHFQRHFGDSFTRYRQAFERERAERMLATGFTVVAVDSSQPDINDGHVGRARYPWIRAQYDEPDDVKIFAIHHHLVSIPGTGRERNIITDAGDLLAELTLLDIDIVLSGHKHVPFFWGVNGILICNSGTATTRRLRGRTPASWNEIHIDASTIKVFLHYPDGRQELSVLFSRKTRAMTREAFSLTDDFLASNQILAPA